MAGIAVSLTGTGHRAAGSSRRWLFAALAVLLVWFVAPVQKAAAAIGYELEPLQSTIALAGDRPVGVAIDQANQRIYVAIVTANVGSQQPGHIEQLEPSGNPTAASPFTAGSEALFSGVAVDPASGGIYAAEFAASTQQGNFGTSRIDQFSSAGTLGTQFATGNPANVGPKIAILNGKIFYPNANTNSVQVLSTTGTVLETITCAGCPGGAFNTPNGVALDSAGNLYVVDVDTNRVVKFTHAGGPYVYSTTISSGGSPTAVAVDPTDDSVFVGHYAGGNTYHVVAYDASGVQFDDFGTGIFVGSEFGQDGGGQIAVNHTTRKLYISDPDANVLRVFTRVTINPPTITTNAASGVGQVTATLNATVNPQKHALTECYFEYVDDAEFLASGYDNAATKNCATLPGGGTNVALSAALSGLATTTTYHYRVQAANNAGPVTGGDQTFTTLPLKAATVTMEAPTDVTETSATLKAKVNPQGGAVTSCRFEYGPTIAYGKSVNCPGATGAVTTDVAKSLKVSALTAGTAYHYRLVVTTNAGTANGLDQEFVTLSPPPPPPPPPPPLLPDGGVVLPTLPTTPVVTLPPAVKCKKGFRKVKVRGKWKCVKKKRKRPAN